jgi:hypothetical protein
MSHNLEDIVEIRPCSLVGAAAEAREIYTRMGFPIENKTIYLWNDYTGEEDFDIGARPRKKHSQSKIAKARNKARREKYRKSRDKRKSGKFPIERQRVIETKVAR